MAKLAEALVAKSLSSTVRVAAAVPLAVTVGASSVKTKPAPRFTVCEALSPSLSVAVAVRLMLLAAKVTVSLALLPSACCTARTWSRVTTPLALTLMVNTVLPPAVPTIWPLTTLMVTAWPVAVSIRPLAALTTFRA